MSFTPEEDRLHGEGVAAIRAGIASGLTFDESCASLAIDDQELRRIVIDDCLKVAIAERHFRDGVATETVAAELRIPHERVLAAREEMIGEVARASVEHFRKQAGGAPSGTN